MKRGALTALICALLFGTAGCVTQRTWEAARGTQQKDPKTGEMVSDAKPAAYAFLPLAVALDVATAPLQLPFLIFYGLVGFSFARGGRC
jgi:hypothetical protein